MLILCVLIACIHPYTDPIMDYTYRTWSWHCSWHCDRDVIKISLGMIFSLFNESRKFWIYLFTFACMKQVLIRDSIVITKHLYPLGFEKGEFKEAIPERIDHPWSLAPLLFAIPIWSPHIQPLCMQSCFVNNKAMASMELIRNATNTLCAEFKISE